jgi:nitric-oxide synthase
LIYNFFKFNLQTYVQDLLKKEGAAVYKQIFSEKGHFYVCGDCTMAEHVFKTLKEIFIEHGCMSEQRAENYMLSLRVCNEINNSQHV